MSENNNVEDLELTEEAGEQVVGGTIINPQPQPTPVPAVVPTLERELKPKIVPVV